MNRREFCRKAGSTAGSAALASITQACTRLAGPSPTVAATATRPPATEQPATATLAPPSTPTTIVQLQATDQPPPTAEPTATALVEPTAESYLAQVALVRTTDRVAGIRSALRLLNIDEFQGRQVLLKPNLNSADPAPGSTHPDTLRTLLQAIQEQGASHIVVGERSGMGSTRTVMEQVGVLDMAAEFGFDVVVFDELDRQAWTMVKPEDSHWTAGFPVPNLLLEAETVVQTCNLKTHQYGGHFTLSLKNSVGFVARLVEAGGHNYMSELHDSPYQRHMIAEINSVYQPALVVMDGVEAFVEGGPAQGKIAQSGVILAGRDRVAIDAAGVAILRLLGTTPEVSEGAVFEQEQIARAAELGLGVRSPSQIQFITGDSASESYANQLRELLAS